jgi:FAD/FMN-containing dehydrogenase
LLLHRQSKVNDKLFQKENNKGETLMEVLHELHKNIQGDVFFRDENHHHHHFHNHHYYHHNDTSLAALFDQASQVWIHSVQPPLAVIQVQTEQDVQTSIQAIATWKQTWPQLEFRIRSGGHNKAGYSTVANGIVLSLVKMNAVQVNALLKNNDDNDELSVAATATLGPAVQVEQFMQQVVHLHNYSAVVGFCGQVAESGFVLGGGYGMSSRLYGLGMDNVVSMRVVLANGSVQEVSKDSDLFWALRGAGSGNFGVVTEMTVALHQTSPTVLHFSLTLPLSDMAVILYRIGELDRAWNTSETAALPGNFIMLVDETAGTSNLVTANILWTGQDDNTVERGQHYVMDLLESVIPSPPPYALTYGSLNWADQYLPKANTPANLVWNQPVWAAGCWCGFLLPSKNTESIWKEIMGVIAQGLQESLPYLYPDIELWGGAIHDKASNATAFPYRTAIYNVGVLLLIPQDEPNRDRLFRHHSERIDSWWPSVARFLAGSYVNYPMTSLVDYPRAYWGHNLERLVQIKNKYDPDNLFDYPMSVPTLL